MELLLEFVLHAIMGLSQMFATALWQTDDPTVIAKRNTCLTVYALAFTIFAIGLGLLWFRVIGLIAFLVCLGLMTVMLLFAGHQADQVEKLVLQQKTPEPKSEGES